MLHSRRVPEIWECKAMGCVGRGGGDFSRLRHLPLHVSVRAAHVCARVQAFRLRPEFMARCKDSDASSYVEAACTPYPHPLLNTFFSTQPL